MKIQQKKVTIRELVEGYEDKGEDKGVWAYNDRLNVRPAYQREFIYNEKQQAAVIDSVMKGLPLNVIYWAKEKDNQWSLVDGQQRTLSIADFYKNKFSYNDKFFKNFSKEIQDQFLDYELMVFECEGTPEANLAWFKTINVSGEKLTPQELRNAAYTGTWLHSAKKYFSRKNCPAAELAKDYVPGTADRQELLQKAIEWKVEADKDPKVTSIELYMAEHQNDANAYALQAHYEAVLNWAKLLFPKKYGNHKKHVDWNKLYLACHDQTGLSDKELDKQISKLMKDSDVTKKSGIYEYVLLHDESALNIRAFDENTRTEVWERQGHHCPMCVAEGNMQEYPLEALCADHIVAWSHGGHTTAKNCQMICKKHNLRKSAKDIFEP